jgi:hypothetical protein
VLEAPTSTVFWVNADGTLRTPSLAVGILASITRDRLIRELDVEEGAFPLDDLLAAREAFLASTVREVQAISAVDETELPECPGERTEEAAQAFAAVLERAASHPQLNRMDFQTSSAHLERPQRQESRRGSRQRPPRDREAWRDRYLSARPRRRPRADI